MHLFDSEPQVRLVLGVVDDADVGLLAQLGAYWQKLFDRRGAVPVRDDFDPGAIPKLNRNLWLIECKAKPHQYHIRLAGSAIRDALGRDATGLRLDQFPFPAFGANLSACCDRSLASASSSRSSFGPFAQALKPNSVAFCEHLAVPLAACAQYPQTVLVASVFCIVSKLATP